MFVSEFMTTKVVSISSDDTIARAARLMSTCNVRRLPVIDNGELVGIIGDTAVREALPLDTSTQGSRGMASSLPKMKIETMMHKEVVTVTPNTTAETALAVAQENKVGALVVVDDKDQVVGMVSTNDFIHRILNPMLGKGKPGTRIHIYDCSTNSEIALVTALIEKHDLEIVAIHVDDCVDQNTRDLIVQLSTDDPTEFIRDLTDQGFTSKVRIRRYWPVP
jgi:acetoin utilization protein AcuB